MNLYLVFDIGGTSIKYGLMNYDEVLVEEHEVPTEAYLGGPAILDKVRKIVASYIPQGIKGIAISTAGMVDPIKGEIFYAGPQIPNYAGISFKKVLEEEFGLPCEVENDVNCAGLAEAMTGVAKDSSHSLCITVGTGIGGCLLINGQVYHGASNAACEIGYSILPQGQLEKLASTTALVSRVAEEHGDATSDWDGRRVFKEAKEGNTICIETIDAMVDYLAQGLTNIIYVSNPDTIVLGGGIMSQQAYLEPKLNAALDKYLLPSLRAKTNLAFAHYQNAAGMYGAFYHFKQRQGLYERVYIHF